MPPASLSRQLLHHRPDNFLIAGFAFNTMRSNMKVLHESSRHKQPVFDVEVVVAFRHAIDFTPDKFPVVRMNAMKH
jgi:hypothetical protein